jgi:hypothetical protein
MRTVGFYRDNYLKPVHKSNDWSASIPLASEAREREQAFSVLSNAWQAGCLRSSPLRIFIGCDLCTAFNYLIPNVPIFPLLVGIQVLNGVLLPVILVFILLLVNDKNLMGNLKNSVIYNILGWGTFLMISIAVVVMPGGQLMDLPGINLFGG